MSCLLTIPTSSRSILANRVAADLRPALERGEHAENGRLPTEADLARIFGVSRASIREAVAELEGQALVRRHQCSETFLLRDPAGLGNDLILNSGSPSSGRGRARERPSCSDRRDAKS